MGVWRTENITRHLPPADCYDMGLACWKQKGGDRRSTLKCRLTKSYKTKPMISWTLWVELTRPEDIYPNTQIIYHKRQDSPTNEAEADLIGKALLAWLEGKPEAEILATLPPGDPI